MGRESQKTDSALQGYKDNRYNMFQAKSGGDKTERKRQNREGKRQKESGRN